MSEDGQHVGEGSTTPLSNWGVFREKPEIGTLNYLTTDVVLRAAQSIKTGQRFPLNIPINEPSNSATGVPWFKPTSAGYKRVTFRRNSMGKPLSRGVAVLNDDYVTIATQGSSQWDSFIHAGLKEEGHDGVFWNGVGLDAVDENGVAHKNTIDRVAEVGIVGRGILIDVARMIANGRSDPLPLDHVITPDETQACLQAQGVIVHPGDIMCFRTGWTERYMDADRDTRERLCTGESGSHPCVPGINADHARMAYEQKWAAVTSDNIGVEAIPLADFSRSAHVTILRNLGVIFGEILIFRELSEVCAADSRWDFFFVAVPMLIPGGMGSPANAIAIR
jgi:kynurenine formamidase